MAVSQQTVVQALFQDRSTLLAYLWTMVRDEHLAEDLFQEVVVQALEKIEDINDEEHLLKWARQTARYKAMNALRKMKNQPLTLSVEALDLLDEEWERGSDLTGEEVNSALRHCMDRLSPYAVKLLRCRYIEGKTGQELADAVGRKLNTTYTALTRVHRNLEDCIRSTINASE